MNLKYLLCVILWIQNKTINSILSMAITFQEQIKRQRRLIFIFIGVVFAAILILWFSYGQIGQPSGEMPTLKVYKKIKINLDTIKHPLLEELLSIPKLPVFEGNVGRENPFTPY